MPRVAVKRNWFDHRVATCDYGDLKDPRWDDVGGGVRERAPRASIYAYVMCDALDGEIAHACIHGSGPHRIKVLVTKKRNDPAVYEALARRAGPLPARS